MKVVELSLHAMKDGETVRGKIVIERRKDGAWKEVRTFVAVSGEKSRRVWMEDGQRLVVEAEADIEVVMALGQNAAVPRQREDLGWEQREAERKKREALEREDLRRSEEAKMEALRRSRDGAN